jgi:hypothetical protein
MESSEEELDRRREWFEWYVDRMEHHSVSRPNRSDGKYACPCCGHLTLDERGGFEICQVCFWEDDGQDDHDADIVRGGPNGSLSLTQARANYRTFGASEERFIDSTRSPTPEEIP